MGEEHNSAIIMLPLGMTIRLYPDLNRDRNFEEDYCETYLTIIVADETFVVSAMHGGRRNVCLNVVR